MSLYNIKKIQISSVVKVSLVIFGILSFITGFCLFFLPLGFVVQMSFIYKFGYWILFTIFHAASLSIFAAISAFLYNVFADKYGMKITVDLENKE